MAELNSMEFRSGGDLANDRNMMALGVIPRRMTREEREKQKQKLSEQGQDASHVPKFIADAPWYMADDSVAALSHQKSGAVGQDKVGMDPSLWYARGQRAGPAATKYRKGACTNCGAMTHTAKECLERPRKVGAKWTGRDIKADEVIRTFDQQSFEGKRDLWNGYDNREYVKQMEEFEKLEEARKALREKKKEEDAAKEDGLSDDEDKYEYEPDTPGQGYDEKTRTSTRNLRIREDIAKYLLTSKNASHYDPKSRSMRELPDGTEDVDDPKLKTGNMQFHRPRGEAEKFDELQKFAWQSEKMGGEIHLQANPTEGELKHRKAQEEAEKKRKQIHASVLEKYGGAEHLAAPPKELLKSTEQFVEYSKSGEVIKGSEEPKAKSKYTEDVYVNNHTSVFGSWFRDGKWGYACCHQFHKMSYCTGEAGIKADNAALRLARGEMGDTSTPTQNGKDTSDANGLKSVAGDRVKRKRPEQGDLEFNGRKMTAADRAIVSEEEYEDYRKNKMARSGDPLLAMKAMDGGV